MLIKCNKSKQANFENELKIKAKEVAEIVIEKNRKYGDSIHKTIAILKILYPNGISKERYVNLLTIVRMLDKLSRLANNDKNDDEDPITDLIGYSLLRSCTKL